MTRSGLFSLALSLVLTAAVHAQPSNDTWHHGTHISTDAQVVTGTTVGATADAGFATMPSCDVGTNPSEPSVWYIFSPTADGDIVFSTEGSDFDTILTVHNSNDPNGLSDELACNDDAVGAPDGTRWSSVTFGAEAFVYYYVRVTGYNGATGNVTLTSTGAGLTAPPNMNWGSYILDSDPYYGSNVGARQEPFYTASCVPDGADTQRAVIWYYEAQADGNMNISLEGSSFDTILIVTDPSGAELACNDDSASGIRWSRLDGIPVTQGDRFFIRVSGYVGSSAGEEGDIAVTLTGSTVVANEASGETPASLTLLPVSPNPASAVAAIPFALAAPSEARVEAFDVLGRSVAVLHDGPLAAGDHRLVWATDGLPSGAYIIRATIADAVQAQQVTVVR